jgi:hypothetical protein
MWTSKTAVEAAAVAVPQGDRLALQALDYHLEWVRKIIDQV